MKTHKTRRVRQPAKKSLAARFIGKYILRLFVAGATARSHQAVLNVRRLCAAELKDNCTLEVVDIFQQPGMAREYQIVATPTLIKEFPRPTRRFIGNLSKTDALFAELGVLAKNSLAA
jgi:circadian clock protein KaiB